MIIFIVDGVDYKAGFVTLEEPKQATAIVDGGLKIFDHEVAVAYARPYGKDKFENGVQSRD